jgi:uncharacterized protein (DUF302 family)
MRKLAILFTMFLLFGITSAWAADEQNSCPVGDAESVDEAVTRITATLERQGFDVVAIINHSENAASVGLNLDPTQVIFFRSPRLENPLLRGKQTVGIDLPFKFLVYEDTSGIQCKFNDIGYLIDRHDLRINSLSLLLLNKAQEQFGKLDNGVITIKSNQSVDDTVFSLRTALMNAGFAIPLEINFGPDAAGKKRSLRPTTLLVFGNPNVGTQLMQNRQEIGLDLPQKFLVFEDREGQVLISYNDPFFIAQRAGIQGFEQLLAAIAGALGRLAEAGVNP